MQLTWNLRYAGSFRLPLSMFNCALLRNRKGLDISEAKLMGMVEQVADNSPEHPEVSPR